MLVSTTAISRDTPGDLFAQQANGSILRVGAGATPCPTRLYGRFAVPQKVLILTNTCFT